MNCKRGDLAVVIRSYTGREGAIVEVIEPHIWDGMPAWVVRYRGSTKHPDYDGKCLALDSQLHPIRGDILNDETTTSKELEAA